MNQIINYCPIGVLNLNILVAKDTFFNWKLLHKHFSIRRRLGIDNPTIPIHEFRRIIQGLREKEQSQYRKYLDFGPTIVQNRNV